MSVFETNFEAAMETDSLDNPLPSSQKHKSGSFSTSATSDESSCYEFVASKNKPPASLIFLAPGTPNKKKPMMTMSVLSSKSQKSKVGRVGAVPSIDLNDHDSFNRTDDDDDWWQHHSPQHVCDDSANISHSEHLPKSSSLVLGEGHQLKNLDSKAADSNESKKKDKSKKKMKRISVTKVKATDLGSISAHQFKTKSGDPVADQKDLQEAIKLWKAEHKKKSEKVRNQRNSIICDDEPAPAHSRIRSKSTARSSNSNEESTEEEPPQGRSRSMARRVSLEELRKSRSPSCTKETESFLSEKRCKSAIRKRPDGDDKHSHVRSVIRNHGDVDEKRRSKSLARGTIISEGDRGNFIRVGRVAPLQREEEIEGSREKRRSKSRDHGIESRSDARRGTTAPEEVSRSRTESHARSEKKEEPENGYQGRSVVRSGSFRSDDQEGSAQDRRSKILARGMRQRTKDTPDEHLNRSSSIRSLENEEGEAKIRRCSKSGGIGVKSSEPALRPEQSKRISQNSANLKIRSSEKSRGRSNSIRNISNGVFEDVMIIRRSKSIGVGLKADEPPQRPEQRRYVSRNNSSNITQRRTSKSPGSRSLTRQTSKSPGSRSLRRQSTSGGESDVDENNPEAQPKQGVAISKSIPWNEFLLQAQTSSRS